MMRRKWSANPIVTGRNRYRHDRFYQNFFAMSLSKFQSDKCLKLVEELMTWKICAPFIEMVDPNRDGAPDYFDIVKSPMALREVKNRILSKKYKDVSEFKRDMDLIWENARKYNGEDHLYAQFAMEASLWFERKMKHFPETLEEQWLTKFRKVAKKFYDALMHPPAELIPERHQELKRQEEPAEHGLYDNNLMESTIFDE